MHHRFKSNGVSSTDLWIGYCNKSTHWLKEVGVGGTQAWFGQKTELDESVNIITINSHTLRGR